METNIAEIDRDYITLSQLLKALGIVQTGGQAKAYLSEYVVYVDDEEEQRRGKKIYPGSRVYLPHEDVTFIIKRSPESLETSDDTDAAD